MTKKSVARVAALGAAALVATTALSTPAEAASVYRNTSWTAGSIQGYVSGSGDYGASSGIITAKAWWNNPYVYVSTSAGRTDKAEGHMSMGFGYVTGSISSSPGVSVSTGSKTCSDSYYSATGKTWVTGQYSGTACTASSHLAVWVGGYSVTGKLRYNGTTWTSKYLQVKS